MTRLASDIFALGVLELDDSAFIQGLSDDERAVRSAVGRMQTGLDDVRRKGIDPATQSTIQFSTKMSALSAALALSGASAAAFGGNVARLIGPLASVGAAVSSLSVALSNVGIGFSTITKFINPLTALVAVVVGLAAALARVVQLSRDAENTKGFFGGDFAATDQLKAAADNARAIAEAHETANRELRKQQLLAEGGDPISLLPSAVQDQARATRNAQQRAAFAKAAADEETRVQRAIAAANRERRVVLGLESRLDLIADVREREALRELELAKQLVATREEQAIKERAILDTKIAQSKQTNAQVEAQAQALAVTLGIAQPSDFIEDGRLRLLAQAGEALAAGPARARTLGGGSSAFSGFAGPGAGIGTPPAEERKLKALERVIPEKMDELIRLFGRFGIVA